MHEFEYACGKKEKLVSKWCYLLNTEHVCHILTVCTIHMPDFFQGYKQQLYTHIHANTHRHSYVWSFAPKKK